MAQTNPKNRPTLYIQRVEASGHSPVAFRFTPPEEAARLGSHLLVTPEDGITGFRGMRRATGLQKGGEQLAQEGFFMFFFGGWVWWTVGCGREGVFWVLGVNVFLFVVFGVGFCCFGTSRGSGSIFLWSGDSRVGWFFMVCVIFECSPVAWRKRQEPQGLKVGAKGEIAAQKGTDEDTYETCFSNLRSKPIEEMIDSKRIARD